MSQGNKQEMQPDIDKEKSGDAFPFVLELKVSPDFSAGEPLPITAVTSPGENHIQWQGAFLEDKELETSADSDRGYLYRMGVRHYSPAFGRFMQHDPRN